MLSEKSGRESERYLRLRPPDGRKQVRRGHAGVSGSSDGRAQYVRGAAGLCQAGMTV